MTWEQVISQAIAAVVTLGIAYLGYLKLRFKQDEHGVTINKIATTQAESLPKMSVKLDAIGTVTTATHTVVNEVKAAQADAPYGRNKV